MIHDYFRYLNAHPAYTSSFKGINIICPGALVDIDIFLNTDTKAQDDNV